MSDITPQIRYVLEETLKNVVGIPHIAWENVDTNTTELTSFVQPVFIPTTRQPAVRGRNPQLHYKGVFQVKCYSKRNSGPNSSDSIASLILNTFPPTSDITVGGLTISISYSERSQGFDRDEFYMVPVDVYWYTYH